MFNILDLECPTKDFCQYNILEGSILQEVPTLVTLLTTSAELLTQDHPIWAKIETFQDVQQKYKRLLGCDKCLQLLQRVGTCLRKMVLLNLSKIYLDLAENFLGGLQSQSSAIMLPSCQQLEYVLLRTQSAAKLICEALHYSRQTFCFLLQKLQKGHLILNLIMATSITARVNVLFRNILAQIFDIFKKLYIWRGKLKKGTSEWPLPLNLSEDIEAWLSSEAADLLRPQQVPKHEIAFIYQFIEKQKNGAQPFKSDNMNDDDDECVIVGETSRENNVVEEIQIEGIPRPKKQKKIKDLTESQSLLLGKIQNANSLKKLKIIWKHLDVGSQVLLGEVLTPYKVRVIEKTFVTAKKKLKKIYQSDVSADVKANQNVAIIQSTGKKLARHLGLIETESEPSTSTANSSLLPVDELKPVKKLKDLRVLYNTLYQMLQSTQQYEECAKLGKKFKDRRADIKRLIENDEKKIARQLIVCTSKEFLTRFKK